MIPMPKPTVLRFYHIKTHSYKGNTVFYYCEFHSCYGWIGRETMKEFASREEALAYAKERGTVDAYGY